MTLTKWAEMKERYADNPAYQEAFEQAELNYKLGQIVRGLREQRSMTQSQLAELIGSSTSAIARLEMGGVEPRISTLKRVANAFGMGISVSFTPMPAPKGNDPDDSWTWEWWYKHRPEWAWTDAMLRADVISNKRGPDPYAGTGGPE